jgi:hypothetical protein
MTANINPFSGETYEIAADLSEPLIIENFDPTKDSIQLPTNAITDTKLPTLPHLRFNNEYRLTIKDGDTFITDISGKLLAVVRDTVALEAFTGYTPEGKFTLVSLDNEFFADNIAPTFFEPWYLEYDKSDYGNSVQKAIDAGLVDSAYEHYLRIGQYEAREDSLFAADTDGNNTLYGTGYETGLVGVPISEGLYTRDVNPLSTGQGEVDTLIGGTGEDTFFLGNGTVFQDKPQAFYVGGGDEDYALIKNFSVDTIYGFPYIDGGEEFVEELTDRIILGGKPYDYEFEKVDGTTRISTKEGDLVAVIEGEVTLDASWEYFPGTSYLYPVDSMTSLAVSLVEGIFAGGVSSFYEPFYLAENPEVAEAIENGEYESALEHYVKVGQFDSETEVILAGTDGDDAIESFSGMGQGASELLFGVPLTSVDGEKEGWTTATTGVGEQDYVKGGMGVTTYFIGNDQILDPTKPIDVYYVGEGDEDFIDINSFDPYKDFIFAAGNPEDYTVERVEGTVEDFGLSLPIQNFEISYKGDLVAIVRNVGGSLYLEDNWTLQEFDFGDERPNAFAFVAPVNEFLPPDPATYFNESVYLTLHPKVQELIDKGEYESAYDYYLEVGEDKGHRAFLTGTSEGNDDITAIGDKSTLIGVEVTGYDKETKQFITAGDGSGETDTLTGNEGKNRFFLGEAGESFYLGNGDADYATIKDFDPIKDRIILGGAAGDYTYETVDGNFQIAQDGDLVAIVEGISDLKPFTGFTLEGRSQLISLDNQFFDKYIEPYFFAPLYPIQNTDVDALIEAGEYTSYYDHFLKAGQFEQREDTVFAATEGNDTLYSIGWENILSGVPITQAQYEGGLDIVPSNLGSGQIDILHGNGGSGKETIFMLGNSTLLNDTAQSFYLGNGDADYALIKNFTAGDRIFLGSDVAGFTQTVVDDNLHIAKDGDLIAIVENRTELASDRANELTSLATESYVSGTGGDDILFGSTRQTKIIGVPLVNDGVGEVYATTTGAGEFDTLNGSTRGDSFYLGIATTPEGEAQPLYVGNGDADYALISNFSNTEQYDSVALAGKVSDYKFEFEAYEGTGNDTKIYTKDGDLIGIVENATLSQFYIEGIGITLYSVSTSGTTAEVADYLFDIEPFFYEEFYLDENPEVADLIASGEYGSAFEHFIEVGQFSPESEVILAGTEGDDLIPSMGNADLVFGVPLTQVDGELEGWEEASTGVGEKDTLAGGLGVTTFVIGNDQILNPAKPNTVYYVGEGDEDYALIQGFQPTQDFIFGAGSIEEYSFETVDGDLKISYGSDLVAIVDDAGDLTLQAFPLGEERPRALALVAPENQFLPEMG